jgi:hypothetical protein
MELPCSVTPELWLTAVINRCWAAEELHTHSLTPACLKYSVRSLTANEIFSCNSELSLNSPVLFTPEQHRNQNLNHTVDMQPVIVISYHSLIQTTGWRSQQVSLCSTPHRSSWCAQDGLGCYLIFGLKKEKVKIYKTKTLHVALYRYKTWSVTLKGEKAGEWMRTKRWGENLDLRKRCTEKNAIVIAWLKNGSLQFPALAEISLHSGLFCVLVPHSVVGRYQHVGGPWCFLFTVEGRTVSWLMIKW